MFDAEALVVLLLLLLVVIFIIVVDAAIVLVLCLLSLDAVFCFWHVLKSQALLMVVLSRSFPICEGSIGSVMFLQRLGLMIQVTCFSPAGLRESLPQSS